MLAGVCQAYGVRLKERGPSHRKGTGERNALIIQVFVRRKTLSPTTEIRVQTSLLLPLGFLFLKFLKFFIF